MVTRAAMLVIALALAACATPGPVLTQDVAGIRTGITAARQQASDSFVAANDLAREQAIARKIRRPELTLGAEDFPQPVPAAAARQWDGAFTILDQYGAALQSLVDQRRADATGNAVASLGHAINASTLLRGKVPDALTSVFAAFGQALVQAAAERKATDIMRAADPAFRQVIDGMATAIGRPDEPGSLANSVASQWDNSVLPLIENDYSFIAPTDQERRRQLLQTYVKAMSARDRQLADLAQLQRSLVALGEAHSAAATGKPGDARFWIKRINSWADEVRARAEAAHAATPGGAQK
jgi:hypothetical protein